jgi:hypothetical protein
MSPTFRENMQFSYLWLEVSESNSESQALHCDNLCLNDLRPEDARSKFLRNALELAIEYTPHTSGDSARAGRIK